MTTLEEFKSLARRINGQSINVEKIIVRVNALEEVPGFINLKDYKNVLLVVDDITDRVAGQKIEELLFNTATSLTRHVLSADEHDQVVANEESLVELLLAVKDETDVLIAVGSGTIHDIVRFVGAKMNKPFISVPTAASVDGFTSKGAPLILKGIKQTVQTASPIAIFADINILVDAPREMTAAGFGDILGKYTSLVDWKISHLIGDEPYFEEAAEITRQTLDVCVNNVNEIAALDAKGIKLLVDALIDSGLVMLALDYSRPASGAEHHLSHYWEMDLLKKNARQLLHGAKVGVATTLISKLYKEKANQVERDQLQSLNNDYGKKLYEHWPEIASLIDELPEQEELQNLLRKVGGPTSPEELGIQEEVIQESLKEAHHLRERCTGLFLINESGC